MGTMYANWRDVPTGNGAWPWKNFSPREMACKGTGRLLLNTEAMDKLQMLREELGIPLIIRSAYRSPEHNRAVGGATRSKHMDGVAFDVAMANHNPTRFVEVAKRCGFAGIGLYPQSGFIHIDLGPARQWGAAFPVSDTNLPPEVERRPETVRDDRELQVVGGGGVVAIAADILTKESGTGSMIERIMDGAGPVTLIVLAVVAYIAWRHLRR